MSDAPDTWRSFLQRLPEDVEIQFKAQRRRVATANGFPADAWDHDDKTRDMRGARVWTIECLTLLLARMNEEDLKA